MDPDYANRIAVAYLVRTNESNHPIQVLLEPPANEDDIIETFVIDTERLIPIDQEKFNEVVSRGKTDGTKALLFCRWCEHNQTTSFPFHWNVGISGYLLHDYDKTHVFSTLEDLQSFKIMKHWKSISSIYHNDKYIHAYETFAGEWIETRNACNGDSYLPYEVLHSLDHSHICTITHHFAEKFHYCNPTASFIVELARQWVKDHPEQLNQKDINNMRPIDIFNEIHKPCDDHFIEENKGKNILENVKAMRTLLTPPN